MKTILTFFLLLLSLLIGHGLWWRSASRRRSLPCPAWLEIFLEKPFGHVAQSRLPRMDYLDVRPGMHVLDVGCGTGRLAIPLAKRVGPNGHVVALDVQPAMLQELEKRAAASGLKNIRTVLGGVGRGLLAPNGFDRALLVTVLGEIPEREREAALREIFDVLKPGGVLSVTEIFPDPHYQSRRAVRRLVEAVGFRLEDQYGSWLAFTMNFSKPDPAEEQGHEDTYKQSKGEER